MTLKATHRDLELDVCGREWRCRNRSAFSRYGQMTIGVGGGREACLHRYLSTRRGRESKCQSLRKEQAQRESSISHPSQITFRSYIWHLSAGCSRLGSAGTEVGGRVAYHVSD